MISFFTGTQNSNFFDELANNFKFPKNKKIIIIVPEQNSFYAEKQAINMFKTTKKEVEILSFSRLAHKIFQNLGGITKKTAKKANKIAIINMVLFQLKNELSTYSFLIGKPDFSELILKTIEQIKQNHINYFQIQQKLKLIQSNSLKLKANEFWLIFKAYNLKLKSEFSDTSDSLKHATTIALKSNLFEQFEFFFSEFFSFSNLQLKLIETIAKQTNLNFHFYYSEENCEIFNETATTIETLKNLAKTNQIETSTIKIKSKTKKTPTMTTIENILINPNFKPNKEKLKNSSKHIKFFTATSIFEEIEWTTIQIINLLKKGHNLNNITILATNLNLYKTTLICSMEKFNLPFFIDDPLSFEKMNLVRCCQNLIETTNNKNNLINCYLNILKTDLTKFSTTEIAIFENYLYTWNIKSSNFNNIFKSNPDGILKQQQNLEDKTNLIIVKKIQKTLIKATTTLKQSQKNSKNTALNLIKSLKILGIDPNNLNFINNQNIENFKQQWNSLIDLLETICESTQKSKIELKQFEFLFKLTARNLTLKQIPQTLNCILIGSLETTIPNKPQTMFILGASELNLPKQQFLSNQIFSDSDLTKLKKIKINFGKTLTQQNNLNTLIAHRAVCSATHSLFISFTKGQSQFGSNEPCQIFKTLQNFFKTIDVQNQNYDFLEKCITKQIATQQLAIHKNENNEQIEALKAYFKKHSKPIKTPNPESFNEIYIFNQAEHLKKSLSPSQIEQFFLCPFAYFCQYILKIKPIPKIEINNKLISVAFHKILEKTVSIKNFKKLNLYQIKTEIEKQLKNFIKTQLEPNSKSTIKFVQAMNTFDKIMLKLLCSIQQELANSNFEPTFFEYEINANSINKPKINFKNGDYVYINGKVDRIDAKTENNKTLIRIIDYKLNNKNLNFSDLLYGLNLQMIIYAMAINNTNLKIDEKNSSNTVLVTAIEYVKILGNLTSYLINERNPSNEKIEKLKNTGFFQNGLVFFNNEINKNTSLNNSLTTLTKTNKISKTQIENKVLTQNELETLFKFTKSKIEKMCESIKNFNFKHTQHIKNINNLQQTNCSFCPYSEICNPNFIEIIKHKNNLKKLEFLELIKKEL